MSEQLMIRSAEPAACLVLGPPGCSRHSPTAARPASHRLSGRYAAPTALTRREREIAALVALGQPIVRSPHC